MDELRCVGGRDIDLCVQGTDGNIGLFVIVWARFLYGGKS